MGIGDPFVLPEDVAVVPVEDLAPVVRAQLDTSPGDHLVTRPRSRATALIVGAQTAALLDGFRAPATIVDAVLGFSSDHGSEPQETLKGAFGVLSKLIADYVLVAADSDWAQPIGASFSPEQRVGAFEVVRPVDVLLDTEVHLGRAPDGSFVALKIARQNGVMGEPLSREAAVLSRLDGRVNPLALELGNADGRTFLALSWCPGVDLQRAADDARALGETDGRRALLALAERVIAAYAHVHAQRVLHGDVHPRNVLVDADERVRIIDYDLAAAQEVPSTRRGGIDLYIEPEFAAARLARRPPPALSAAGELYSVAALVYLLLTGAHTHTFSLEEVRMLHQIVEEPPLPFARHGIDDLPAVERTLDRALSKDPAARFPAVKQLLDTFRIALASDRQGVGSAGRRQRGTSDGRLIVEEVLERLAIDGPFLTGPLDPPTASVMRGAAGSAYGLLRIAGVRGDEALLATADLWALRAVRSIETRDAFRDPQGGVLAQRSLYHASPGVFCVQALVARARDDHATQLAATNEFLRAAEPPSDHLDVASGIAGLLLGASMLLEALPPTLEDRGLRALGDMLGDRLCEHLADMSEIHGHPVDSLGVAHGWAGILYALLRWSDASSTTSPPGLARCLDLLAALAEPEGRGLCWPLGPGRAEPEHPLSASWCSGAAGFVHLWTAAHRCYGDEAFERLAERSAWCAYHAPTSDGGLCCGLGGRAYGLLCMYKQTGDTSWLLRARQLAESAAASMRGTAASRASLYDGAVGVAVLAADLQAPEHACMPVFESEGWPPR